MHRAVAAAGKNNIGTAVYRISRLLSCGMRGGCRLHGNFMPEADKPEGGLAY